MNFARLFIIVVAGLFWIPAGLFAAEIDDLIERAEKTIRPNEKNESPRIRRNELGQLTALNLDHVDLASGDLELIVGCEFLESLSLIHTRITDDDLKQLARLKRLRAIRLNHTSISDKGLENLSQIKSLQSLCLGQVEATPEGVAALKRELPRLQVGYSRKPAKN